MTSKATNTFSPEVRARAVRMVLDRESEHSSRWAGATSIAGKIGCSTHSLMEWMKKADIAAGRSSGMPLEAAERLKALEREPGASPAQRDPAQGIGLFCSGGARPSTQAMIAFIDNHRGEYGVEPICKVLPIGTSTYHEHMARHQRAPAEPTTGMADDPLASVVMDREAKPVMALADFGELGLTAVDARLMDRLHPGRRDERCAAGAISSSNFSASS